MERWVSLYLAACALLGDENRAGDLVLKARDESHLEEMLRRVGELPQTLPAVTPDLLDHVSYLRKRARFRRMLTGLWAGAALLAVVATVVWLAAWRGNQAPAQSVYTVPPVAEARRDDLVLKVHRAEASPGVVTIWWSLAGPGVGLQGEVPEVAVGLYDRWRSPEENGHTIRRVNRDLLHGKVAIDETMDQPAEAQLAVALNELRIVLGFEVDRTILARMERRVPVQQFMGRSGVGLMVYEIVQGPGYTRLVYEPYQADDSPFRLLTAPAIERVYSDAGMVSVRDRSTFPWRLGPLSSQATEVRLVSRMPLRVETDLRVPLRVGASDPTSGVRVQEIRESSPGSYMVTLSFEGEAVGVETVSVVTPDQTQIRRFRWGINTAIGIASNASVTFMVASPTEKPGDLHLHIESLFLAPPEELRVRL